MKNIDAAGDSDNAIRIATPGDFQEVFRICCLLHAENGMHAFSELKVRHFIWRGLNRDNAIVGVIGPSADIKAIIYLCVDPVYYSDDVQLVEMWNFVRADCRKSDFAKRMIQFAKRCADEIGCDLTIGIISNDRLAAKERLYSRLLPKGGSFFIHHGARCAESMTA